MTEDEARAAIRCRFGDAYPKLELYEKMLRDAASEQNLIAPSTVDQIWSRHIVDSAQLLHHAPPNWRTWVDVGSGAGLPGVVLAVLEHRTVTLIEPRRLRCQFLNHVIAKLGLRHVTLSCCKAESVILQAVDVVSARAVATIDKILEMSGHFTGPTTTFIMPRGAGARSDMAKARQSWHGEFHVKHSIIDPNSGIVIATRVSRR